MNNKGFLFQEEKGLFAKTDNDFSSEIKKSYENKIWHKSQIEILK